jgi:hypothetical protein
MDVNASKHAISVNIPGKKIQLSYGSVLDLSAAGKERLFHEE